jgi:hypothetical protein
MTLPRVHRRNMEVARLEWPINSTCCVDSMMTNSVCECTTSKVMLFNGVGQLAAVDVLVLGNNYVLALKYTSIMQAQSTFGW